VGVDRYAEGDVYVVVEGLWGKRRKVASAREPDNGLLLAMLVWLNLETKKKRESSR
jgi:hypothetical protein